MHTGCEFNLNGWTVCWGVFFRALAEQKVSPREQAAGRLLCLMDQSCYPLSWLPQWQIWCNLAVGFLILPSHSTLIEGSWQPVTLLVVQMRHLLSLWWQSRH